MLSKGKSVGGRNSKPCSSSVCSPVSSGPPPSGFRGSPNWPNEWAGIYNESESSDFLSQSVASSTSWSDELEGDLTKSLQDQLRLVQNTLYHDGSEQLPSHSSLRDECLLWQHNFPHLRILGQNIKPSVGCQTRSRHEEIEEQLEEIISAHGDCNDEFSSSTLSKKETDVDSNEIYNEKIKKAVIDQIFLRIWPEVVKKIAPVLQKAAASRGDVFSVSPELKLKYDEGELTSGFNSLTLVEDLSLRTKSGRRSGMSARRLVSTAVPVKPITLECSIPVPSSAVRTSSALRRSPSRFSQAMKHPSPERLLSPLQLPHPGVEPPARNDTGRRLKVERRPDTRPRPQYDAKTGRMIARDNSRSGIRRNLKTSPPVPWSRHVTLPPIETTEIFPKQTVELKSKRSTSALFKGGRLNSGSRPNTSLTAKNQVVLSPLDSLQIRQTAVTVPRPWPPQHNYANCETLQLKQSDQRQRWKNRTNVMKRC